MFSITSDKDLSIEYLYKLEDIFEALFKAKCALNRICKSGDQETAIFYLEQAEMLLRNL